MQLISVTEWRKRYSPIDELYSVGDVSAKLGVSHAILNYYVGKGYKMADQKRPLLAIDNNGEIERLKR